MFVFVVISVVEGVVVAHTMNPWYLLGEGGHEMRCESTGKFQNLQNKPRGKKSKKNENNNKKSAKIWRVICCTETTIFEKKMQYTKDVAMRQK
jgi:hypothetical protein